MTRKVRPASTRHRRLYSALPVFQCKVGCTDCCGPVPFSKWEWSQVKDKRTATDADTRLLRCPYSRNGKCDIYEHRPMICRMFGTVEDLRCPHGCRPESLLTQERSLRILRAYKEMMD